MKTHLYLTRHLFRSLVTFVTLSTSFFICSAQGLAYDQIEVKSPFDRFLIDKRGSKFFIENAPVDIGPLADFIKAFNKEVGDPCPNPLPRFPLSIHLVTKEKSELAPDRKTRRQFSFNPKLLTDGEGCAAVHGRGLYYLPLHRTWFDQKTETLPLGEDFRLRMKDQLIAHFEKVNGIWQDARDDQYVDWYFFERLLKSLDSHLVSHRLSVEALKDRPQFIITSGKHKYLFAKVDTHLWAVKAPNAKWLVASSDWSFLEDMSESQWKDRFAPVLKEILNSDLSTEERVKKLRGLQESWTPTIRQTLHRILLNSDKPSELRQVAAEMLRRKPSQNNLAILIEALGRRNDKAVDQKITAALQVVHPKGPALNEESTEYDRQEAIKAWREWWKKEGSRRP